MLKIALTGLACVAVVFGVVAGLLPRYAGAQVLAEILTPTPGTVLQSSTANFTWTTGENVTQYWLWVSTVEGDGNIYSQSQSTDLSATVTGLPTNVRLFVRMWSL